MISKIRGPIISFFSLVMVVFAAFSLGGFYINAYGQSQILPFDINDIISQNETGSSNLSNPASVNNGGDNIPCNMPPCPPGQACIQSCPQ